MIISSKSVVDLNDADSSFLSTDFVRIQIILKISSKINNYEFC